MARLIYESDADDRLVNKAIEVYDLERSIDPLNTESVRHAIKAVLHEFEQHVLERVIVGAEALAANIKEDVDPSDEGAAALELFAEELRHELPQLGNVPYNPEAGDLVELLLVGEVTVYDAGCPNCGEDAMTNWSIRDRFTGLEIYFDPHEMEQAHVRVISKGEPYFMRSELTDA